MDDFLFDVATVDLETCKIIIELSHTYKDCMERRAESRA